MERAYLEVYRDDDPILVELDGNLLTIGRARTDGVSFPSDATASREHALLERLDHGWCLRDTGSSNGTFVNGQRVTTQFFLRPEDEIAAGGNRIVFMVRGANIDSPVSLRNRAGHRAPPRFPQDLSAASAEFDWLVDDVTIVHHASGTGARSFTSCRAKRPPPVRRQFADRGSSQPGHATVVGQARGIQQRSERYGDGGKTVLAFRVERYDNSGNRLRPVPVQLRATWFDGSLCEGDEVRVTGRWKNGTLHTDRVENMTTGAAIMVPSSKGCLGCLMVFLVVVALVAILFVVFFASSNFQ
ncbi:FHA domain-containing protein [Microtetraspora sp. NBRC 16547]|uniref:FHA domain-containing protein n=1 Tax=Microtetraspora sp. NBRC 16547 TaxID=3030993 RepID=UPI0024A2EA10|nr:FHA domain-containing protein [Microtetraspora sp. NBRC 16547]GLW96854.1 hypothetical protein Misp02_09410 [Microtetraspora sp. NBRC 16547]